MCPARPQTKATPSCGGRASVRPFEASGVRGLLCRVIETTTSTRTTPRALAGVRACSSTTPRCSTRDIPSRWCSAARGGLSFASIEKEFAGVGPTTIEELAKFGRYRAETGRRLRSEAEEILPMSGRTWPSSAGVCPTWDKPGPQLSGSCPAHKADTASICPRRRQKLNKSGPVSARNGPKLHRFRPNLCRCRRNLPRWPNQGDPGRRSSISSRTRLEQRSMRHANAADHRPRYALMGSDPRSAKLRTTGVAGPMRSSRFTQGRALAHEFSTPARMRGAREHMTNESCAWTVQMGEHAVRTCMASGVVSAAIKRPLGTRHRTHELKFDRMP